MALNFHQLHIFYTVAQRGSFSSAAQILHMTQPAVTMQVQSLEDHFSTKLFIRSTKRVELTEAGHKLLPYAERSIAIVREADQAMAVFTQQQKGRLQLGASLTIGEYILPRLLGPFGQEFPHVGIRMKVMNTAQIMEEILTHQLDFGLVEAPVHHPDMQVEVVMSDELMLVVPHGHPLAEYEAISLADILDYPLVVREKGSGTRHVMEEMLKGQSIDPDSMNMVMELGSTGAVKSAVEAGIGISFLSPASVRHEAALGLLHVLPLVDVRCVRQFYAIHLKAALLPVSAVTFLTFLRERDLQQWLK